MDFTAVSVQLLEVALLAILAIQDLLVEVVLLDIMIIVAHVRVVWLLEQNVFNVLAQSAAYSVKLVIQVPIAAVASWVTI